MRWIEELEIAKKAARLSKEELDKLRYTCQVLSNCGKDIKLTADRESEKIIINILKQNSNYPILAEETGESEAFDTEKPYWIVDPLDGTANYSRHIPLFCISIALWQGDSPILGVIYDANNGEMYWSIVGEGSWCNGNSIRVSNIDKPKSAILATGFPVYRCYSSESLTSFLKQIQSFKKIRMIGSAALSLAFVAAGKFDAYSEEDIMLWDIAAGAAIVKAAGGWVQINQSANSKWARNVKCASSKKLFME